MSLLQSSAQGMKAFNEKIEASEVRKTIKNCANEVPEGNSMTFASAMCNAGLKS